MTQETPWQQWGRALFIGGFAGAWIGVFVLGLLASGYSRTMQEATEASRAVREVTQQLQLITTWCQTHEETCTTILQHMELEQLNKRMDVEEQQLLHLQQAQKASRSVTPSLPPPAK